MLLLRPWLSIADLLDKGSLHILVLLIERCFTIDTSIIRVSIHHVIAWFSRVVRCRVCVLSRS